MTPKDWLPKAKEKFNAYQRANNIPTQDNPQTCLTAHDYYIASVDNVGNQRRFHHETWRFEKFFDKKPSKTG